MNQGDAQILTAVRDRFHSAPPARLGVAVSGGGDSVALLHILTRCFDPGSVQLFAATIDHGLRPEAGAEVDRVRGLAETLGVSHTVLRWRDWDGRGNLQDQARRARYKLLSDWAKTNEIAVLTLGHTADDQAETVIMRLARGAGVNGLSAMAERRTSHGITMMRPLLGLTRTTLRDYLVRNGVEWSEDSSNEDTRFERIRVRKSMAALAELGLTATTLSGVARNLSQAREALDWYSFLSARDIATINGGDVVLDLRQFRTLPDEIGRRLLVRAISWVSGAEYPPRRAAMAQVLEAVRHGRSTTLAGCRILRHDQRIWVCREYNAVRDLRCEGNAVWDHRWRVTGPEVANFCLRPLGRGGLALCKNWRDTGRPFASVIAAPSLWDDDRLLVAPNAGKIGKWSIELIGGGEEFFATLLSH